MDSKATFVGFGGSDHPNRPYLEPPMVQGAWHSEISPNTIDLQCFIFQFGCLELCLGGLILPKPPVATGPLRAAQVWCSLAYLLQ